ncbi:hypothetical protein V495_05460 [Pseudogymnoascus sp. VKM F-4514 (FW-929)]|nr:hypothetical protein V495_05460 [Pseudogymnoascus sp. VKM F-4514 (FW-929)]KFY67955.1 hypothetical protein V497_00145 [Pseudogymnoascus sp. VKM F-4516 (FW-969)]
MAAPSVLITGCSQGGAGEALARRFHKSGFRVFATARNLRKIEHLISEGIEILELDILENQSVAKVASSVSDITGGTLDILINNAGGGYMTPILDMEHGKASKLFDMNVFAPITVAKAFLPLLIAGKGTIVNIGSYVDTLPVPWQGIYNASKSALRAITDNLRLELRPFNVNVVYIAAGGIDTNFLENLDTFHLSETSLYYSGKDILEPIINYESQKSSTQRSMPPSEFADEVYDAAVAGVSNYRAIAGTQTPLLNMPEPERDDLLAGGTGIKAFAERIQQGDA